mgnify:CR=1 FL=1
MTLCLALSYGGRESIVVHGARALAELAARGALTPRGRSPRSTSRRALQTGGLPPARPARPHLRRERLSNFLLWEAAYAELYFTDTLLA